MKKFQFALDSILNYRQNIEEQEKERLARAMQKVQKEAEHARELDGKKYLQLSTMGRQVFALDTLRQHESYLLSLDGQIERQQKKLDQAIKTSDLIRTQVVTATSNRKILESLKDKHLSAHRQEMARAEQNILDEVGITAYIRKDMF